MEKPLDIWIRDWGFAAGRYFRYDPSYARGLYGTADIQTARQKLSRRLGFRFKQLPLKLDGGNLVHNGRVAIVIERVFLDNPEQGRGAIERMILSIGFERVVFIPSEPNDDIGHADGILRFLPDGVLVVNDYQGAYFSDYRRLLFRQLGKARLADAIVPFPWLCTSERLDGVWSAVGVYVNFVSTGLGTIVPVYGRRLDQTAIALLESLTKLPVKPVKATELARFGGSLNCITLHVPSQFARNESSTCAFDGHNSLTT